MLLTEDQAANRVCPQRYTSEGLNANCVASQCMAWRWKRDPENVQASIALFLPTGVKSSCDECQGSGVAPAATEEPPQSCEHCEGKGQLTQHAAVGYCGLAGLIEVVR